MAIATLAGGLEALGHRVEALASSGFPLPLMAKRALYNVGLPARLARRNPDLAVGFDVDGFLLPGSRLCPLVVALKGVAADEARFERGPPAWKLRSLAVLEGRNARRADRVVVPSRYSARAAADAYGLERDAVRVVPEALAPGTRRALEERAREGEDEPPPPTILSVARQYPRKNTRTLLRGFRRLLDRVPEARLRVVGGGPLLSGLRALSRELGLGERARLLGPLPRASDLWDEYAGADCFCLPTRQEGFGIVFLEAMAAGLPVVAGRAGAVPEVVPHGEAGILVEPMDADALADALARVLTDPKLAARLAEGGRRRAARFTPEASARRFLAVVDDLLPARDRGRTA